MQKIKRLCVMTIAAFCLAIPTGGSLAKAAEASTQSNKVAITPYVLDLSVQTQMKNGIKYKRRWNRTNGTWYDRFWVKMSEPFPGPK